MSGISTKCSETNQTFNSFVRIMTEQHAREIQPFGTIAKLPIALARDQRPHATNDVVAFDGIVHRAVPSLSSSNVFFHDTGGSQMRLAHVLSRFTKRAPLAQQVPALIELDLYFLEPASLGFLKRSAFEQLVLFRDQLLNVMKYGGVAALLFHLPFLSAVARSDRGGPPSLCLDEREQVFVDAILDGAILRDHRAVTIVLWCRVTDKLRIHGESVESSDEHRTPFLKTRSAVTFLRCAAYEGNTQRSRIACHHSAWLAKEAMFFPAYLGLCRVPLNVSEPIHAR